MAGNSTTRGRCERDPKGSWALRALLSTIVPAESPERRAFWWSFTYFFALLCSYYILRSVRDEMGVANGIENLQWLFTATFVAMLVTVPIFGRAVSRLPRARLLPRTYWFFLTHLVVFFVLFRTGAAAKIVIPAFFVWLSVFNLVVVSVFWSFMADLFTAEQGARLFGLIAAGGSAGALVGPALTVCLAVWIGPVNLLVVSAFFLLVAVLAIHRLIAFGCDSRSGAECRPVENPPVGGGAFDGIWMTLRSPYLVGICLFIFGYTTISTLLYFEQAEIITKHFSDPAKRTAYFATVDLAVNASAILLQVFATGRLVRWLGLAFSLASVPLLVAVGLLALSAAPTLTLLVAVQVAHRAGSFTLLRPGREMLFTAVERADKYKSKYFVDTVVYRSGDALSGWALALLRSAGLGFAGVAIVGVPVALVWTAIGFAVGRMHVRKHHDREWKDLSTQRPAPACRSRYRRVV